GPQHRRAAHADEPPQRGRLEVAKRRGQVVEGRRQVALADGVFGAEDDRTQAGVFEPVADGGGVRASGRDGQRTAEFEGVRHTSSALMRAAATYGSSGSTTTGTPFSRASSNRWVTASRPGSRTSSRSGTRRSSTRVASPRPGLT